MCFPFFTLGIVPDNFLLVLCDKLYQLDLSSKNVSRMHVDGLVDWIKYNPIDKKIYWVRLSNMEKSNLDGTNKEPFGTAPGKLFPI